MRETENLKLKMPEKNEYINIADINENTEKIDNELAKKADASGGDISETVITTVEASQAEYPVPAAGDSVKTVLGKVQKFFTDIRNWMTGVCLLGQIVNNCVTDNAKLPLSAAQGKVLMDLYNVLNTKMPTGNKKIYFDGNIQTFGVRSGEHDLNNIYLDFLDKNGTHCYIGFMTEGTKGVVFYSGNKLIWKITV